MKRSQESLALANDLQHDLDELHYNMPTIYGFLAAGGKLSMSEVQ